MLKKIDDKIIISDEKVQSSAVFLSDVNVEPEQKSANASHEVLVTKPQGNLKRKLVKWAKPSRRVKSKNLVFKTYIKKNESELAFKLKPKEIETGMLTKARKIVKRHYSNKRGIYNLVFVLANFLIILFILLYQKNYFSVLSLKELFSLNARFIYIFYAFVVFVIIMLLETLRTHILIYRSTNFNRPMLSYKSAVVSSYYDSIVPVAGGKPFELFYLNIRGIKPSIATSVPLAKYIFSLVASIVVSTVVIISKWSFLQETSDLVLGLGIIMLVVNLSIVIGMLLFASSHKTGPRLALGFLKLLQKIGIIKDYRNHFMKFMRFVLEYQKSIQYYVKTRYVAVISTICSFLITFLKALIPFFIYAIFATPSWELMLDIMSKYYILQITINFIPIPGGAGVAEISFATIFNTYFAGGTLFWALILWRFFSYYIYIIQGFIVLVYDFIMGKNGIKKFSDPKFKFFID